MTRSIVLIPCYNEAERLDPSAFERFTASDPDVDFLFVDDGSTDDTARVLEALCARLAGRASLLRLERNAGKAEAVRRGALEAFRRDPGTVGYWDADLATPLDAIAAFREILDERPDILFVFGSRVRLLGREIERRTVRHYLGRVFATAASLVLDLPVYDTQCGAKLFRVTPEVRAIFADPFVSGWIFDVELIARYIAASRREGLPAAADVIYELPLLRWHDVRGSKIGPRDYLRAGWDLLQIQRTWLRRS